MNEGYFACTLFSSSKGNCTYIRYKDEEFLIDIGASARSVTSALHQLDTDFSNIKAVFLTHEHTDHTKGLETLLKHYKIPVYAPFLSALCLRMRIGCPEEAIIPLDDRDIFNFDNTSFKAFRTPHDSEGSVCYRITMGDDNLGYATDIGHITDNIKNALSGCGSVVLESNHDIEMLKKSAYPASVKRRILSDYGHLSNDSCAELVFDLASEGTRHFMLAHLSQENNRPELAYSRSCGRLSAGGIHPCTRDSVGDVSLSVAAPAGLCIIGK